MKIVHKVRGPQRHFHNFLKTGGKGKGTDDIDTFASMAKLVFGKAEAIADEYNELLNKEEWESILDEAPMTMPTTSLQKTIASLVVQGAADFHRRVVQRVPSLAVTETLFPVRSPCAFGLRSVHSRSAFGCARCKWTDTVHG